MPFVVGKVLECNPIPGRDKLKIVRVDIGDVVLTIVTNAPNIRDGTRTVVATVGTEVDMDGETQTIKNTSVGGVVSEGMVCDSVMLSWAGGAAGLCVQLPDSYPLGSLAPASKPRMDGSAAPSGSAEPELSAKDLKAQEKAARKAANAEKKAARKAKKGESEAGKGDADDEPDDDDEAVKG